MPEMSEMMTLNLTEEQFNLIWNVLNEANTYDMISEFEEDLDVLDEVLELMQEQLAA